MLICASVFLGLALYTTQVMYRNRSIKKLIFYIFCNLTLIGNYSYFPKITVHGCRYSDIISDGVG
jgi:hypothetical protein